MNKLILCEGATDAILLSYYLNRMVGWTHTKKAPPHLDIKTRTETETANWYQKGADYLLISAVGGKDNFGSFFDSRIKAPLFNANAFDKIAVVTDRDQRDISDIECAMSSALSEIHIDMKNDIWVSGFYRDAYKIKNDISVLLVIVPKEHQGALETVMLDAISEDSYNRNIVKKAGDFSKTMRLEAGKYISTDRLQLKAHLGVTWAVQFPEKVFSLIDEQIQSVRWEESEILRHCFSKLIEI